MTDTEPAGVVAPSTAKPWYWRLVRLMHAAAYMAAHLGVALLLIGGITLVSRWISRVGDPMFFDLVPVRYLFDLMDATVVAVFGWYGVRDTRDAFREEG